MVKIMYMLVNCIRAELRKNLKTTIDSAEQMASMHRTIVYDWKPRNQSVIVWDTGRERCPK